jgi:hypothetical protein
MDKQPRQRQCDGQQQPGPQPGRQQNPHTQRPFFFPRPQRTPQTAPDGCALPTANAKLLPHRVCERLRNRNSGVDGQMKRLFTSPGRLVAGAVSCCRSWPGGLQYPW